jgi:acylphosphatase
MDQRLRLRAGAESEARRLGLRGWARNNPDGSVEIMAEGERSALEELLGWCSHGPAGASVSRVENEWLEYSGEMRGFVIRR